MGAVSVHRIADEGMTDMRKVFSNLVHSSRERRNLYQRIARARVSTGRERKFHARKSSESGFAFDIRQRRINQPLILSPTSRQRHITFLYRVFLKLRLDICRRFRIEREKENSGRRAVQPVYRVQIGSDLSFEEI